MIANDAPATLKAQLGETVIEFDMGEVRRAARARQVAATTTGGRVEQDGSVLRVTSNDGSRALIDVLHVLDAQQLSPSTLEVREPSLDDVFLLLTGHRAGADGGERPQVAAAGGAR